MFFSFNLYVTIPILVYFLIFIVLLKIRSVNIPKTWFVPLFALYFGVSLATLFAIFLDGSESFKLLSENSILTLVLQAFNPKNGLGKVMYGGYFGSIVGILFANLIATQKPASILLDISSISWSVFLTIWRIGCFFDGCCYGCPSETLGIAFSKDSIAFRHLQGTALVVGDSTVPLLPTQLISSFWNLFVFLFLLILFCKNKTRYPYFYFFAQMFLYGVGRFIIEFFRIDPREFWGSLSMSQWISLVLIAVSLAFFIKNRKRIFENISEKMSQKQI